MPAVLGHDGDRSDDGRPVTTPGMVLAVAVAAASASGSAAVQEHGGESDRGAGPRALVHRPGARAAALGGSFWVGERNEAAVFHHPALLGGTGFGASYAHLADGSALMSAGASGAWFGGTAGIGLSFADGVSIRGREAPEGGPEHGRGGTRDGRPRGRDDGFGHAPEGSSFVLSAGFAADVLGLRAGGIAKVVGRSGPGKRRAAVALDFGAAMDAGPLALALSVQNLGPGMEADDHTVPLPARVALGVGTDREPAGPFDVGAAAHLAVERGAGTRGGAGVEVAWWPVSGRVFVARGGLAGGGGHRLASTFGAGFEGDRIRLDYGYGPRDGGASRHAVSLAFR